MSVQSRRQCAAASRMRAPSFALPSKAPRLFAAGCLSLALATGARSQEPAKAPPELLPPLVVEQTAPAPAPKKAAKRRSGASAAANASAAPAAPSSTAQGQVPAAVKEVLVTPPVVAKYQLPQKSFSTTARQSYRPAPSRASISSTAPTPLPIRATRSAACCSSRPRCPISSRRPPKRRRRSSRGTSMAPRYTYVGSQTSASAGERLGAVSGSSAAISSMALSSR
jgi:hypothetical protein